jgi:hypothetical protein
MRYLVMLIMLALVIPLAAQASHSVTLTWVDTQNPTGTTYNVKRATGTCTGTPSFSTISSAVAVKTYTDSTVTVGNYCYIVTAVFSSIESAPSYSVNPVVGPFTVTLSAVVN